MKHSYSKVQKQLTKQKIETTFKLTPNKDWLKIL